MKKTPLFLLVFALTMFYSSKVVGQTRFGLKAGFSMAEMPLSNDYQRILSILEPALQLETKWLPTYHAGAVVEFGIGGKFGIGTGLQLNVKGSNREFGGQVLSVPFTRTKKLRPMYLQLPLSLTFRTNGLYAGIGPYIGYAVGGKAAIKTTSDGASSEGTINLKIGDDINDDLTRLDYGAGLEIGYEFGRLLRVSASYTLGLANVLPSGAVDFANSNGGKWKASNNVASISLTYLFNGE